MGWVLICRACWDTAGTKSLWIETEEKSNRSRGKHRSEPLMLPLCTWGRRGERAPSSPALQWQRCTGPAGANSLQLEERAQLHALSAKAEPGYEHHALGKAGGTLP